jgi:UDPglucose 6-dehydrogenase
MELISSFSAGQFTATLDEKEATFKSNLTFIIVPTPSNTLDGFSNENITNSLRAIGDGLRRKAEPHYVSIVSTILPMSSAASLIPALEQASGRKIGDGLGYCYNPSFIAQGDVMRGIVKPDYVLIGEADRASGDTIEAVHRRLITNNAPIVRMSPLEAEITKIASNTHETMRVAFANMLLALCNELPGVNIDRVTNSLGYRLGNRFFKGAVPYGGPCWPRDNRALASFMDLAGVPSTLPNAIDLANAQHGRYVLREVLRFAPRGSRVGLIGLAYKPGTSMIDCSFGIDLARWLASDGRLVVGWDPLASGEALRTLGDRITIAAQPEECLACDVVVIVLPLIEIGAIDWSYGRKATVIDCWRAMSFAQQAQVAVYIPLGLCQERRSRFDNSQKFRDGFVELTS